MQTILIVLNPGKLKNPDLDLSYRIPDRIEAVSGGAVQDNGYDFLDCEGPGPLMGIWLKTKDASAHWPMVAELLRREEFLKNDLSRTAEIYISTEDSAELSACTRVFPQ